ncbi:RING finger protein nhl-1-like [Lineus longissimus]|uniref:RING finger protein nhl-1-like n=1 Tax=Lineus longissimus TaxID=88925 RepID=UPI002B4E9C11
MMGDATYSAEQIEQLLKCPVCLDRFNQPKILPCQHTFCKSPCLQGLILSSNNRFIKCPECRAQHLVPREGIDGFATNITIAGFLDLQARAPAPASATVETDQVDSGNSASPLNSGCGVCNADLELVLCHHCDKRVCDSCRQSHVRQMKLDIGRVVNQLRRKIPKVSDLVGQVEHGSEQVRSNVDSIKAEINNTIEKHVKELRDRQNVLNTELEILLQTETRSLRLHQENLEVELASIASFCDSTEGAVSRESTVPDTDLVAMRQQSSQLMAQCLHLENQTLPQSRQFRWDYNGQNTMNMILNLGDIAVAGSTNVQNGTSPPQAVHRGQRNGHMRENIAFIAPLYERGATDMLMPLQRSPGIQVPERRGRSSNVDVLRNSDSRLNQLSSRSYQPPHLRQSHPAATSVRHTPPVMHQPPAVPSLIRTDNSLFTTPARPVRELHDDEERAFAGFISFSNPNFRGNRTRPQVIRAGNDRRNNRRNHLRNNQSENSNQSNGNTSASAAPSMPGRERTFTVDENENSPHNTNNANTRPGLREQGISFEIPLNGDEASGSANIDNAINSNIADQAAGDGPVPLHDYRGKTRIFRRIGSRGNGNGKFTWPRGVAVGPNTENIHVADSSNHRVQIFSKEGQFLKSFGSYGQNSGEFDCLAGITVNASGQIIISDRYNHRVQIFNSDGNFVKQFGEEGPGDGKFSYPWGVCCDSAGCVYVCDKENHRIQKFQADGTFVRKFGSFGNGNGKFENPHYVAVNDNTLVVSDHGNHRIQVFDLDGNHKLSFGSEGTEPGQLKYPKGVAIDQQGFILVGNSGNNRIDVFRGTGSFFCSFGGLRLGNNGNLKSLEDIALMANGRVIACNRESHNLTIY